MEKLKTQRSPAEVEQIKSLLMSDNTFYKVFQRDFTNEVMTDLYNRLYGKIPRNFLLSIEPLIGTGTGIFKSTIGLQIGLKLSPTFSISSNVAFSINEIIDKIQNNTEFNFCTKCLIDFQKEYKGYYELHVDETEKPCQCGNVGQHLVLLTKLIFFLDEQTKTLKHGGLYRLQNIVDTVRQRQICFIVCGVDSYDMNFSTYSLRRVQESSDDYLPKKRVRYAVYDDARNIYYGYFSWDVTPLTDVGWKKVFDEYSVLKTNFQRVAISQKIQSMSYEDMAQKIMNSDDFQKCFKVTKKGDQIFQTNIARLLIDKEFPDLTNENRMNILSEIKLMIQSDGNNED